MGRKAVELMHTGLKKLKGQGYDVDQALHRMLNDEVFYLKLLKTFSKDNNITVFKKAMSENNYAAAFEAAHKLKGSAATLGLTPIMPSLSKVLEDLRAEPPNGTLQIHFSQAQAAIDDCLHLLSETIGS